jgi:pimeloyl-ACP methyl ester carboxylesterase
MALNVGTRRLGSGIHTYKKLTVHRRPRQLDVRDAMDAMTLDRWGPFRNDSAVVRCRIFAFPHAGGHAASYWPLRRLMPAEIDFCPIESPGRAAGLGERPLTSMSALMEGLHQALRPLMTVPVGFFGHSVGAWMAYEAATTALDRWAGPRCICSFPAARAPALPPISPRSTRGRDAFFVLWTRKEATVKGLGVGLAANLGRVEFEIQWPHLQVAYSRVCKPWTSIGNCAMFAR